MRLLERDKDGKISLTKDFVACNTPRYAILSHTWGTDTDEVTLRDLVDGTGKSKTGYTKIRLCGEQARRDGLQYIWVDTCCIDKSNSTELSEAINSMFRWYRDAVKCYVYLSDVSRPAFNANNNKFSQRAWESAFRKSRWFTRGWTLQELLAPSSVEFFSKDWEHLGNKTSLERQIHEITEIPVKALQGSLLSDFSIIERMSWAERRQTTREEDMTYSLLGIFGVYMPLIYGEGRENALRRLREEIDNISKGMSFSLMCRSKHDKFSVAFSLFDVFDIDHFVGREEELVEMHKALSGGASRRIVVLHGLGGIGKTQLTIAYTKRHRDDYSAIFWLNIKDEYSLAQSFVKVAKQIVREDASASRLSNMDMKGNPDEVIEAVKSWLSLPNNTRWLLVFDNYDNPKLPSNTDPAALDVRKFFPESYQGSIIVTTRLAQVRVGVRLQVKKLQNARDSLEILSNASSRKELMDDPDAKMLCKELDGLPLALATAGAYLDQVAISLPEYIRLYKASWSQLQKTTPELSSYEDRTLYSTWQISFDHVRKQNELSAKLLRLWAYFDNQDLWFELLQNGNAADPEWIRHLTQDELTFNAAIRALCDHGLVEVDSSSQERIESRGYSIHNCVYSWTIYVLNQEWDHDLARLAAKFVGRHSSRIETNKWWLRQRRLLHHAARCSFLISSGLVAEEGIEWVCDSLGGLFKDQGKLIEAEKMYQRAVQGHEKTLGPDHTSTLEVVNTLGAIYHSQFKLGEAEEMYQRALKGKEKVLGVGHKSTLKEINNLGVVYADQGKLNEAEKMYQQALQLKEKVLGLDHKSTLASINNLGTLYGDQHKFREAEEMFQRALQRYEKTVDSEDIYLPALDTISNLGSVCHLQGKLEEAEKMYHRVLQGYEKIWGMDHESTTSTVVSLAALYISQERLGDAEDMYRRAIQSYKSTNTLEDIRAMEALSGLCEVYYLRYVSFQKGGRSYGQENLVNCFSDTIVALTNFCEELGMAWPSFFSILGRMLMCAGQDDHAVIALQHQIQLLESWSEISGPICDGCEKQFREGMERFVCRACEDIDLCDECYKSYQEDKLIPLKEEVKMCKAHPFLAVPEQEKGNFLSGSSLPNPSLTEWLTAIRAQYQTTGRDL